MKFIILLLVLFALNAASFTYNYVNGSHLAVMSWSSCLFLILSLLFYVGEYQTKTYGYMISFFHSNGNGRAFITSNTKKIDGEFICELENHVAEKYQIEKVLAISVQRMEGAA